MKPRKPIAAPFWPGEGEGWSSTTGASPAKAGFLSSRPYHRSDRGTGRQVLLFLLLEGSCVAMMLVDVFGIHGSMQDGQPSRSLLDIPHP